MIREAITKRFAFHVNTIKTFTSRCKWLPGKPVHETTRTAKYGKVTETIRDPYLMHADEHTKV